MDIASLLKKNIQNQESHLILCFLQNHYPVLEDISLTTLLYLDG